MDSKEIIKEYTDSIEISRNAKGEPSHKVKVYGDAKTEKGREEMEANIKDLEIRVKRITK